MKGDILLLLDFLNPPTIVFGVSTDNIVSSHWIALSYVIISTSNSNKENKFSCFTSVHVHIGNHTRSAY